MSQDTIVVAAFCILAVGTTGIYMDLTQSQREIATLKSDLASCRGLQSSLGDALANQTQSFLRPVVRDTAGRILRAAK